MEHTIEQVEVEAVKKYIEQGISTKTISVLMSDEYGKQFTEAEIIRIRDSLCKEDESASILEGHEKLANVAYSLMFDLKLRRRIKIIAMAVIVVLIAAAIAIGIFVSWIPVALFAGIIILVGLVFALVTYRMIKGGKMDKML